MTTRVIIGVVALACVLVCSMVSTFARYEMMDKVNEKLPKEEQFGVLWWPVSKYQRLNREYKRLYPDGGLLSKVRVLTALTLMFAFLLVCVWGFGIFAK
ncbi:MAG TPA: hypothetical protein VJW94_09120 [Candidatus Acidoferrum sp.]|nr:hypothetical protein [Candidatus Acidoferrum sp.]